jgi:hypothetical protein
MSTGLSARHHIGALLVALAGSALAGADGAEAPVEIRRRRPINDRDSSFRFTNFDGAADSVLMRNRTASEAEIAELRRKHRERKAANYAKQNPNRAKT